MFTMIKKNIISNLLFYVFTITIDYLSWIVMKIFEDFEEFLDLMRGRDEKDEKDTREEIEKVFQLFDIEGKNSVTVKDLQRVAKELGERLSIEEVTEIVKRACSDENSMEITADDFYNIMTKKTFP